MMWNGLGRQETGRFSATRGHRRTTIRQKWMVLNKGPILMCLTTLGEKGKNKNKKKTSWSIGVLAKHAKKLSSDQGLRL